jgi:hypothetical protein
VRAFVLPSHVSWGLTLCDGCPAAHLLSASTAVLLHVHPYPPVSVTPSGGAAPPPPPPRPAGPPPPPPPPPHHAHCCRLAPPGPPRRPAAAGWSPAGPLAPHLLLPLADGLQVTLLQCSSTHHGQQEVASVCAASAHAAQSCTRQLSGIRCLALLALSCRGMQLLLGSVLGDVFCA